MADDRTPLLAVLIDGDNSSHNDALAIFEEIATLGEASVRRVYGDFSSTQMKGWSDKQAKLGIVPHHQPANTVGKNASDIALVIDAMDLLHSGRFDGFVLVSSDSDFTRLAQRIREQGKDVYGIGRKKTPAAFRMACKRFIYTENLTDPADATPPAKAGTSRKSPPPDEAPKPEDQASPPDAQMLIADAIEVVEDDEGFAHLGQLGKQLLTQYPDFDPRTYGYKKLSDLVSSLGYKVQADQNTRKIRAKPKSSRRGK